MMTQEERDEYTDDIINVGNDLADDIPKTIATVGGAIFAALLDIIDALRQDTVREDTSAESESLVRSIQREVNPFPLRRQIIAHIRKLEATR